MTWPPTYASCLPSHGAPHPSSIPGPYTSNAPPVLLTPVLQCPHKLPLLSLSGCKTAETSRFLQLSRQVFGSAGRPLLPLTPPGKTKAFSPQSLSRHFPESSTAHTSSWPVIVCPPACPRVCASLRLKIVVSPSQVLGAAPGTQHALL